jgi:ubiquinone/menaquinone biosynthesis C-methylase UbiE
MDTPWKDQVANNYDRIGKWYDLFASGSEKHFRRAGLRYLNAVPGETVLEIGFGTGHSLVEIAEAVGQSGKVYGIDISRRMLEIAKQQVAAAGYGGRIELQCMDASTLPYAENTFDALFMSFVLEVFEPSEIGPFLCECRKVIKSDGRMCIVAMSSKGKRGIMMKLYEWAHAKFPNTVDCGPIDAGELIRAGGFEVVENIVASFWGLSIEIVRSTKRCSANLLTSNKSLQLTARVRP